MAVGKIVETKWTEILEGMEKKGTKIESFREGWIGPNSEYKIPPILLMLRVTALMNGGIVQCGYYILRGAW